MKQKTRLSRTSNEMNSDCPLVGQNPRFAIGCRCLVPHVAGVIRYEVILAVSFLGVGRKRRSESPMGTRRPIHTKIMLYRLSGMFMVAKYDYFFRA